MKKFLSVMLALMLIVVLGVTASAADTGSVEDAIEALPEGLSTDEMVELIREAYLKAGYTDVSEDVSIDMQSEEISDEVRELAYMDIDQADEETQAKILEARKAVIYTRSWRADDVVMVTADSLSMNFEISPKFSDLFPNWDLPVEEVDEEEEDEGGSDAFSMNPYPTVTDVVFNSRYNVPASVTGKLAPIMCTAKIPQAALGQCKLTTSGLSLPTGMNTFNVGYTDIKTGKSIAHKMNIPQGTNLTPDVYIDPKEYPQVGVRTSTQGKPGIATMDVTNRYKVQGPVQPSGPRALSEATEAESFQTFVKREIREKEVRVDHMLDGFIEVPAEIKPGRAIPANVLKTANMDISKADAATKKKILSARNQVIYSYSWTVRDCVGVSSGVREDGQKFFSIEPVFEDLFPGWDVPCS